MYGVRGRISRASTFTTRSGAEGRLFPRAGFERALVEERQSAGRRGIVNGGSSYGCVFTGGAVDNLFNFATIKRPTGSGLVRAVSNFVVLAWVAMKALALTAVELGRALLRLIADPVGEWRRGVKSLAIKVAISVWVRQLFNLAASRDIYRGVRRLRHYLDYYVLPRTPRHRPRAVALRR